LRFLGKLLLFAIIITAIGGAWMVFAGQQSTSGKKADIIAKEEKEIYSRLMAVEPSFYFDDYGMVRVHGSVKNVGAEDCAYAKFEIQVRDKKEKLLKTLKVTVKDIQRNSTKSYDINGGTVPEGISLHSKIVEAGFNKR